jgi:hypothetical protein
VYWVERDSYFPHSFSPACKWSKQTVVQIEDLIEGRNIALPFRIVAPGRFYESLLKNASDLTIVVAGITASSAVYLLLKYNSSSTIVDLLYKGLGAILLLIFFAYFNSHSRE